MRAILGKNAPHTENACLVSGDHSVHHLDHLAVIAFIMDAPIVSDSEKLDQAIRTYYPQVKPIYIQFHQQILEYLASNHERLFFSVAPYGRDLSPLIEAFFGKKIEFWYCPHGNSDKTLKHYSMQQQALIYGDQMEKRLQEEGHIEPLEACVRIGNPRFTFYTMFKDFYDNLVEKEIFSQFDKKQRVYLYAPTWEDFERSSSFFDFPSSLIKKLPDSINLIIKMHPWLEEHQPGYVHLVEEMCRDKKNIITLCHYPLIFPILERTDLYIGDFSSIGYDFLLYDRPMFFLDPKKRLRNRKNDTSLHTCGVVIPTENYGDSLPFIETHIKVQHLLSQLRQKLYRHAFGKTASFASIKKNIEEKRKVSPLDLVED